MLPAMVAFSLFIILFTLWYKGYDVMNYLFTLVLLSVVSRLPLKLIVDKFRSFFCILPFVYKTPLSPILPVVNAYNADVFVADTALDITYLIISVLILYFCFIYSRPRAR
jgi:hypothetical protein